MTPSLVIMKNVFLVLLAIVTLPSCALHSKTTIGPKKAFELGDGQHGSFKASVHNDSKTAVDVYEARLGQSEKKLLTLQPGQKQTVRFGADTKAIFKNETNQAATVTLKVTGDTGLTMGGPNYN